MLFVTQAGGGFLDGRTVAEKFNALMLALFGEPGAGKFAEVPEKVSAQRVTGNAAPLGK